AAGVLDDGQVADGVDDRLDLLLRRLGVGDLTAAEADGDLHLVALLEEALDVVDLEADVVLVGLGAELDLLELDLRLALLGVGSLLLLVLLGPAVVHVLADRGHGFGVHFDEIEAAIGRHASGGLGFEHAEHLAVLVDDTHLGNADALVRTRTERSLLLTVARVEAGICQNVSPCVARRAVFSRRNYTTIELGSRDTITPWTRWIEPPRCVRVRSSRAP